MEGSKLCKLQHVIEGWDYPRVSALWDVVLDVDFAKRSCANGNAKEWEALAPPWASSSDASFCESVGSLLSSHWRWHTPLQGCRPRKGQRSTQSMCKPCALKRCEVQSLHNPQKSWCSSKNSRRQYRHLGCKSLYINDLILKKYERKVKHKHPGFLLWACQDHVAHATFNFTWCWPPLTKRASFLNQRAERRIGDSRVRMP